MPNGAPGDAPWSDFFVHGNSIFPPDMCVMLHVIRNHDVALTRALAYPEMWEAGRNLDGYQFGKRWLVIRAVRLARQQFEGGLVKES